LAYTLTFIEALELEQLIYALIYIRILSLNISMDLSAITYSVFIPLLNKIHALASGIGLASYGWSIVILTAIVKLALTPLTYKQIKSTKKMQVIQPKLKGLQEKMKAAEAKHASQPEKLAQVRSDFQKDMMTFYKENNVNPLGGCLPLLIQMPILLGLFWTFSGSPFKAKPIFVDVKVVNAAEAHKKQIKPASKAEIYVDENGKRARIVMNTKGVTLVEGESFDLNLKKTVGAADFQPAAVKWEFMGAKKTDDSVELIPSADGTAKIIAKETGKAKVQAILPGSVKDSFLFVENLGETGVYDKVKSELNIDILILVLLFGTSIWLSSRLNTPKVDPNANSNDPQVMMQKSMSTMMPVMMTVMMMFIPLPAGALIYMIVSGFIQSGQTFFANKRYQAKFAT
jgi:YidC/Oxa1 family membrane protein insertase